MDSRLRGLLLCAIFMCFTTVAPQTVSSPNHSWLGLNVVGYALEDANGAVILRSVNRGDPTLCTFESVAIEGPIDSSTIPGMLSWGVNGVRILLNEFCWLNIGGVVYGGSSYQNDILTYVNNLTAHKMAVILTLAIANAGSATTTAQSMPNTAHSTLFWQQVSTAYASYTNVIFDLYDQPWPENSAYNTNTAWACWQNGGSSCVTSYDNYGVVGMQTLVNTIRAHAPHNVIMIAGIDHGNSMIQWKAYMPSDPSNPSQEQIIGAFHVDNQGTTLCNNPTCWTSDVLPIMKTTCPVFWVTYDYSVSPSSCVCQITCAGAAFVVFKQQRDFHMSSGYWDADLDCTAGGLVSTWSGTPYPVYGTGLQNIYVVEQSRGE